MTNATFEKVSRSKKPIYGPRKLLLCGFDPADQLKFNTLLEMLGLAELPRVWGTVEQKEASLAQLMGLKDGTGQGKPSGLPRAIIMAGITEEELHQLMGGARNAGMRNALWATLTPVSETWTLGELLAELTAERQAMQRQGQSAP
jgi:hypothetical protein